MDRERDEGRGIGWSGLGGGLKAEGFNKALAGLGIILADAIFRTLKHELKDFHRGHIVEVQILSVVDVLSKLRVCRDEAQVTEAQ